MNRIFPVTSFYACVIDRESPANRPGIWDEAWQYAAARSNPSDAGSKLAHFNQFWINLAKTGDLLAWTLLFNGVFHARVVVAANSKQRVAGESRDWPRLGCAPGGTLRCPSGELAVVCMSELGNANIPTLATVAPGSYFVLPEFSFESEERHSFLEDVSEYPEGDGPDWVLCLHRAST